MTTVIGLTGGIASGKSVVSSMLAERGALIIDADKVGHEAYAPGNECYAAVVQAFGPEIVATDGTIDRKALGGKVFGNPDERKRLEGIVWPWMKETMDERLKAIRKEGTPVVVLEAAVLIEADWIPITDEVWVVIVPPELARERVMQRNNMSAEDADARINAQLTNDERKKHAKVVIENTGTLEELDAKVGAAWEKLTTN